MYIYWTGLQCTVVGREDHQTRMRWKPKAWVLPNTTSTAGDLMLAFYKDDDDGDNEVDEGHNALITIFPWKPFVNLGLHPPALLCYAVLGYRACGHPTLLQHPKPWSVSCHPQDYMVSRAPNTKHRYVKKKKTQTHTNDQTIGKQRTAESLRTFCWLPKKMSYENLDKNLNHYGTP